MRIYTLPKVALIGRHKPGCAGQGNETSQRCDCPIYGRYSPVGKQIKTVLRTRIRPEEQLGEELQLLSDPGAPVKPVAPPDTIGSRIPEFLATRAINGISVAYQIGLRDHLRWLGIFTDRSVASITRDDCERLRGSWAKLAPNSRRVVQVTVRSFFQYCDRADLLPVFKRVNTPEPEPMPLSDEELMRLLAAATDPLTNLYIRTASSLGMACVDMCNLTRTTVAKSNGVLRYNGQKSGRAAVPPISPELKTALLAQFGPEGVPAEFIFWDKSLAQKSQINKWILRLGKAFRVAGLLEKGNVANRLRDTCAKFYFDRGANASEVGLILGDLATTVERHYRAWAAAEDERRIAALGAKEFC